MGGGFIICSFFLFVSSLTVAVLCFFFLYEKLKD